VSCNDEAWVSLDEVATMCAGRGAVQVLSFPTRRYVGAQIGVHSPTGERVGLPGRLHNLEHLVVSGSRRDVARAVAGAGAAPAVVATRRR